MGSHGGDIPLLVDASGRPVLWRSSEDRITEVVRSYSLKLNLQNYGGNAYESVDLFASQKVQCLESEKHDASLAVYSFCRSEVMSARADIVKALRERQEEARRKSEAQRAGRSAA